jgi:hypothetical protein
LERRRGRRPHPQKTGNILQEKEAGVGRLVATVSRASVSPSFSLKTLKSCNLAIFQGFSAAQLL